MRKKVFIAALSFAAVLLFILAVLSYGTVKKKLNLQSGEQNTIELEEKEESGDAPQQEKSRRDVSSDESASEEKPPQEGTSEEISGKENSAEEEHDEKKEIPVITLNTDRVEIKVGEFFDELSPVKDVSDNKDSREELSRRIRVRGEYDIYTPGEYILQYFVIDSEEYQSEIRKLTLIVTAD